ncbi:MAG TPA: hypothetical protein VFA28_00795 [Bryobacteraceae bacterium]|nr:hypothetical protein [Bryobacteraceae bacterium]
MAKRQSDSELLREGCRSYHKALFAVMQFRREVQDAIRAAVDERIDDIAAALKLDKAEISDGLSPYADPANFGQNWDGSEAEVGLKYPGEDWEAKWGIYFYFWIGDGDDGGVGASCWIKEPGAAMTKLAALNVAGMDFDDCTAWVWEPVGDAADGFPAAMRRALDVWIDGWHRVGGLSQFLPSRKVGKGQANA